MSQPTLCVVVPTIRPDRMVEFRQAWASLFERHQCQLVTVWDGDAPQISADGAPWVRPGRDPDRVDAREVLRDGFEWGDLFCRRTDAVRNVGFVLAAKLVGEYVYTLDDDCLPPAGSDPIQEHLDALAKRVPLSWINTAMPDAGTGEQLYLRGVPYGVRDEAPVMLSHGVWVNVPDFDGETQLALEARGPLPYTLPYYRGPIPRNVMAPICAMNVMFRREMLPHYYLAPMGADSGEPDLHRFGDIWGGIFALQAMHEKNWACYSGGSLVVHQRASDARKNCEQERLGRRWNEAVFGSSVVPLYRGDGSDEARFYAYFRAYADKRRRYAALIESLLEKA